MFKMIWMRLKAIVNRRRLDRDLEDELAFHQAMAAERANPYRFGNRTSIREACRDLWTFTWLENVARDLRLTLRTLRRSPAFSVVAILSLALGIGANTAVFSLLDTLYLKSLPVRDPGELRVINWSGGPKVPVENLDGTMDVDRRTGGQISGSFSYAAFREFQRGAQGFQSIAGFSPVTLNVVARGQASRVDAMVASGNFFVGLGAEPVLGRAFTEDDDRPPAPHVAVLSHRLWERQFGADPAVLGSTIALNRTPYTVIGVMGPKFFGVTPGAMTDVYLPLCRQAELDPDGRMSAEDYWWVQLIGRLQPGKSDAEARASLDVILSRTVNAFAGKRKVAFDMPKTALVDGRRGMAFWDSRTPAFLGRLLSIVALVLLIACANIANLLLARANARSREISIRASLGAGRSRLVRQFLTESLTLALIGGGLGLMVASWSKTFIIALMSDRGNPGFTAPLDGRVIAFTALVSIVTGLLFGIVPALRATRGGLGPELRQSGAVKGFGPARQRLSKALVTAQVAISLLLVVGAGLFVRSLVNLAHVELGFQADHVLLFRVDPVLNGYEGPALATLYQRIRASVEALPGVRSVTLSAHALVSMSSSNTSIAIPGVPKDVPVVVQLVGSGFLSTMGTPVLVGRDLADSDSETAPKVAVINETLARRHFAGNPIGRVFNGGVPRQPFVIVGVAGDSRHRNVREAVEPMIYVAYRQRLDRAGAMYFEARTTVPPLTLAAAVRRAVADIDATLPVTNLKTQEQQIDVTLGHDRTFAFVASFFSGVSVLLASIGLYGLMAYAVSRRTSEIGLRLALGAGRSQVQWMMLRESLALAVAGVAIGVPAALMATRWIEKSLYGVKANDPASIAAAAVILMGVATLAAWIPARRAARVDPMVALRYE